MKFARQFFPAAFIVLILALTSGLSFAQDESKDQKPKTDEAKKVVTITEPEDIYQISVDDLVKTDAAKSFKAGDFKKALEEFELLKKLYPHDITVRRYIGICYERLGQYKEAIAAYNEALLLFPYHVPTHFYKGIAFIKMGDTQRGLNELRFVAGADPEGPYGQRAKQIIPQVQAGQPITPPKPKPWQFYGRLAWMYDTNVTLAPKDKTLRAPNQNLNANRYETDGTLVYQIFQESDRRVNMEYGYSVSLNDHNLSDFNFYLQRGAVEFDFINEYLGKQWLNTARHDFSAGFLDDQLFTLTNTTSASTSTSFFNQTRTTAYVNFGYTQFGPDGFDASQLSRDGYYEGAGISHTLYNPDQTKWITFAYNWSGAQTRGQDFDFFGNSGQVTLHTPVIEKFVADYSAAFQYGQYPHFNGLIFTRTAHRKDYNWTQAVFLSRPIGQHFTWRAFYRWFDTQDNNAIFAFDRNIAGTEIDFTL